jgi:hypothetical protein
MRRLFLALWLPAALRLMFAMPSDGFTATYAMAVGGAVAALATMALQMAGLLLTIVGIGASGRRRRRPHRTPA